MANVSGIHRLWAQNAHQLAAPLRTPQQARTREGTQKMLDAGRHLLNQKDIDQISIKEIVSAAGASIGSFYHRFETKDAFFRCLVEDMVIHRESAAMANFETAPTMELPETLARGAIDNHRRYSGMLRSAIRSHLSGSDIWHPFKLMGQRLVDEYIRRLECDLKRPLRPEERERVAFGFVWLYGLLAQSVMDLNSIAEYNIQQSVFEESSVSSFVHILNTAISDN